MNTIDLTASAAFGKSGHYVARITGRDSKFTFARDFVGRNEGKRGETRRFTTDAEGMFITCDIDRRGGRDEEFWLLVVHPVRNVLVKTVLSREEAMTFATQLDKGVALIDLYRTERKDAIEGLLRETLTKLAKDADHLAKPVTTRTHWADLAPGEHTELEATRARVEEATRLGIALDAGILAELRTAGVLSVGETASHQATTVAHPFDLLTTEEIVVLRDAAAAELAKWEGVLRERRWAAHGEMKTEAAGGELPRETLVLGGVTLGSPIPVAQ